MEMVKDEGIARMQCKYREIAIAFLGVTLLSTVAPVYGVTLVLEEGDPAPGVPGAPDATFWSFRTPTINDDGEIAVGAQMSSSIVVGLFNSDSIWFGPPGNLQLIVLEGESTGPAGFTFDQISLTRPDPIPDRDGFAFDAIREGTSNRGLYYYSETTGQITEVLVEGNGIDRIFSWSYQDGRFAAQVDSGLDTLIMTGDVTGMSVLLGEGDVAPGFQAINGEITGVLSLQAPVSSNGDTVLRARVESDVGRIIAIYGGQAGSPRLVASSLVREPAYGDCDLRDVIGTSLGPLGEAVYQAVLFCDSAPTDRYGIFVETTNGIAAAVTTQSNSGVSGANFAAFSYFVLGEAGTFAAISRLDGPSVTFDDDEVVIGGSIGDVAILLREDEAPPGFDSQVRSFLGPVIEPSGAIVVSAGQRDAQRILRFDRNGLPSEIEVLAEAGASYIVAPELPGQNQCVVRTFDNNSVEDISLTGNLTDSFRGTNSLDGRGASVNANGDFVFEVGINSISPNAGIYTTAPIAAKSQRPMVIWLDFETEIDRQLELKQSVRRRATGWALTGIDLFSIFSGTTPSVVLPAGWDTNIATGLCNEIENSFRAGQFLERIPVTLSRPQNGVDPIRVRWGISGEPVPLAEAEMDVRIQGTVGRALNLTGFDRFNRQVGGEVFLQSRPTPFGELDSLVREIYERFITSLIFHEVGHTFGLRHNNGSGQPNTAMDNLYRSQAPIEFSSDRVSVVEPPNPNSEFSVTLATTHNPEYHLRRFGWCTESNRSNCPQPTGLTPGSWDLESLLFYGVEIVDIGQQGFGAGKKIYVSVLDSLSGSGNAESGIEIVSVLADSQALQSAEFMVSPEERFSFMTYSSDPDVLDIFVGTGDVGNPEWGVDVSSNGTTTAKAFQYIESTSSFVELGSVVLSHSLSNVVAGTTSLDSDGDGLSDEFEQAIGSDPLLADSDGDGLSDFDEVAFDGDASVYSVLEDTDPLDSDTDGDGEPDLTDEDPLVAAIPLPLAALALLGALLSVFGARAARYRQATLSRS